MNWNSTAGKSALVKMLMQEHGVSKRKSEKAVNAVFDCMARALRRGDQVELPIGWIQTARSVDPNKSCADADLPGYLDRLLARLQELVRGEYRFPDFWTLRDTVRQLYSIRK